MGSTGVSLKPAGSQLPLAQHNLNTTEEYFTVTPSAPLYPQCFSNCTARYNFQNPRTIMESGRHFSNPRPLVPLWSFVFCPPPSDTEVVLSVGSGLLSLSASPSWYISSSSLFMGHHHAHCSQRGISDPLPYSMALGTKSITSISHATLSQGPMGWTAVSPIIDIWNFRRTRKLFLKSVKVKLCGNNFSSLFFPE